MATVEQVMAEVIEERRRAGRLGNTGDFLDRIWEAWAGEDDAARTVGVARDVILVHSGAQSNLYAALAWTLIEMVRRPELVAAGRTGDETLLGRCANEAIRLRQRSITLREVLRPLDLELETGRYRLGRGALLTTMLACTNTTAVPGLESFDPNHYEPHRRTLAPDVVAQLPTKELVSTFGHGPHSSPAARISISAIVEATGALIERYDLSLIDRDPVPRRRQLGGVARAQGGARLSYRLRSPLPG